MRIGKNYFRRLPFLFCISGTLCFSQERMPHRNAHAHNDYEHTRPLMDALRNGFTSVEADVHLRDGVLVVAHNSASERSPSLEKLYLKPLDSLLSKSEGRLFTVGTPRAEPFYLMIDIKSDGEATYQALKIALSRFPVFCASSGPVRIFLSGNRPIPMILKETNSCVGIDGRPEDLGKGYSPEQMPVVSDHFRNWSHWNGKSPPMDKDVKDIIQLAQRVHGEGKKLRLWSIPDNKLAWETLLNAGVDFINTDRLEELNTFLTQKGL